MKMLNLLHPDWHTPQNVRGFTTLRQGGVSLPPFDSLNLGAHVGDDLAAVETNRARLADGAQLPQAPLYLNQTHSTRVIRLPYDGSDFNADAVYTNQPRQVCLVMTADCLPVLFCSRDGREVAAAHAGWRGLCDGILEQTVAQFACPPAEILAWLGPAIGKTVFQVGQEVVDQFCAVQAQAAEAFRPDPQNIGKYYGDLYQLARQRLNRVGVWQISGGDYCTYSTAQDFFSFRRDKITGRMATLIWTE